MQEDRQGRDEGWARAPGGPDVGFELDTYQPVLLTRGPKAAELDEATIDRLGAEHIRHNLGMMATGKVLGAGAVVGAAATRNTATGHPVVGLGFSALPAGEVRELKDQDPGVRRACTPPSGCGSCARAA